jgi:hypothetical protein
MQEGRSSPCCGIPCCENTESLLTLKFGHDVCLFCLMAQKKNRPKKPASMYALFNARQACSAMTRVHLLQFERVCCSPIGAEPMRTEVASWCAKLLFRCGALFVEASFFCGPRSCSCMTRLRRLRPPHPHFSTVTAALVAAVIAITQAAQARALVIVLQ